MEREGVWISGGRELANGSQLKERAQGHAKRELNTLGQNPGTLARETAEETSLKVVSGGRDQGKGKEMEIQEEANGARVDKWGKRASSVERSVGGGEGNSGYIASLEF